MPVDLSSATDMLDVIVEADVTNLACCYFFCKTHRFRFDAKRPLYYLRSAIYA